MIGLKKNYYSDYLIKLTLASRTTYQILKILLHIFIYISDTVFDEEGFYKDQINKHSLTCGNKFG